MVRQAHPECLRARGTYPDLVEGHHESIEGSSSEGDANDNINPLRIEIHVSRS